MGAVSRSDTFGFLPVKLSTSFSGVIIEPTVEYDETLNYIKKISHEDGFIYPPISQQWKAHPITLKPIKRIPKTKRPAHLYRINPSHKIIIESTQEIEELRNSSSGFLMHLLGYLYGVRLQFHDWFVDGRVPIKLQHNISVNDKCAKDFLFTSYRTWNEWSNKNKKLMTNILYMHCRAISYEWDWERFAIEYMVFDGCCNLAKNLFPKIKLRDHTKRLLNICKHYDIPVNKNLVNRIVKLRNGLFHSTLWGGQQPCTAPQGDIFIVPYHLNRLNNRIIPALLGNNIEYTRTPWWTLGTFIFK